MRELKLWRFIYERLKRQQAVMLMCVVESTGSSPGRQGFKMAVTEDQMCGTIGGGMMEHKFVELAKEELKQEPDSALVRKQFHQKSAAKDQSGMICSGEQTILLFLLSEKNISVVGNIITSLEGFGTGFLKITSSSIDFSNDSIPQEDFNYTMRSGSDFIYSERIGWKNHLYIIGGGHCALALSRLMSGMDFCIHLYEERKDINTLAENQFIHEKKIVNDYTGLASMISEGENQFVAVMTFGYRTDDIAVRALVNKNFRYMGVLGSESKMKQLFTEWRADGIPEGWLSKIFAPIGIPIKSETPEEIAVSIAAQIIKVKNSKPLT